MKTINSYQTIILILGLLLGCLNTHAATDCTAVTEISQIECESLLQLYHSTDGANWINNNGWNITNTPCSWFGVTCENNSVVSIIFFDFPQYNNNLVGTIPDFTSLLNLQVLNLEYNELTGEIPDFSNLPDLPALHLKNNKLTGSIPI